MFSLPACQRACLPALNYKHSERETRNPQLLTSIVLKVRFHITHPGKQFSAFN